MSADIFLGLCPAHTAPELRKKEVGNSFFSSHRGIETKRVLPAEGDLKEICPGYFLDSEAPCQCPHSETLTGMSQNHPNPIKFHIFWRSQPFSHTSKGPSQVKMALRTVKKGLNSGSQVFIFPSNLGHHNFLLGSHKDSKLK